MQTVILASIVLIAVGAFATFAMVELLPQEILAKAENDGRFAGLGDMQEVSTRLQGSARRDRNAWRNRAQARRQIRLLRASATASKIASRRLANGR